MQKTPKRIYFFRRLVLIIIAAIIFVAIVLCIVKAIQFFQKDTIILTEPMSTSKMATTPTLTDTEITDVTKALDEFCLTSSPVVLSDVPENKNILYSPISMYMALAMLSECAEGEVRQEILSAMFMDQLESDTDLAASTDILYQNLLFESQAGKLTMTNSLWVNAGVKPKQELLDILSASYHASAFGVDFTKQNAANKINQWVNNATEGMIDGISVDPATEAMLLNTVYFAEKWQSEFDPERTGDSIFHTASGADVTCPFMYQKFDHWVSLQADGCLSSYLTFKNNARVYFAVPDENSSVYGILENIALLKRIIAMDNDRDAKKAETYFSVPKVDFRSDLKCTDAVQRMGISKAFDPAANLFDVDLQLISINQSTAFMMDEQGAKAAAVTSAAAASAAPEEFVNIILDRPFVLIITSPDSRILFVGIVNDPKANS